MRKIALALILMVALIGCAGQKAMMLNEAIAEPSTLEPGDSGLVKVTIVDPQGLVGSVSATVREYTQFYMDLNDSGHSGDEEAGDGIWSTSMSVPWEAPAGTYHLFVEVFDKDGLRIKTQTEVGVRP